MNDLKNLFGQQAEWQRAQANLPWAEKLRLSVIMREALLAFKSPRQSCGPSRRRDEQSEHSDR